MEENDEAKAQKSRVRKRKPFLILAAVILFGILVTCVYLMLTANDENTDDAQVESDVVPVAARVSGQVLARLVEDNQRVKKGTLLVQIDDVDFAARVKQADAELETARAQAVASAAQVLVVEGSAKSDAHRTGLDLNRIKQLVEGNALPQERLDNAQAAYDNAQAVLGQISVAHANAELARARVKVAEAALDLAKLQLSYTKVVAPDDGEVSKISVQAGQMIQVGQPLAELVPERTYIIANYKETQVGRMRPGQPAQVTLDAFPGVKLEGRVESLSGGTGARFSLLPPDNASGNFVKVVQRVPVRIAWAKPPALPIQAGLSVDVTVDVGKR